MRFLFLPLAPLVLMGCTTIEVVRIAPPETLVATQEVPALDGTDNEALVRLAEKLEAQLKLCNTHKQLIQEFYDEK